ncbi:hypothetical protein BCR33DRAFT_717806 [Rhizoclosmatium globosum]|uniref:Uncharacterized protein n=1 Tax=Rhizoclosmatium globosum TaxID=329046 RepID=A0A1Y2C859_9FUNG|nr:hypothetical protein BCR33DRAFT_717806 [Rhizoclosmatium globosum]|eukprot:ORY43074.1 hypothetical protein BCR33DRAFT_717806 [Rhizoclosmatium globosum]
MDFDTQEFDSNFGTETKVTAVNLDQDFQSLRLEHATRHVREVSAEEKQLNLLQREVDDRDTGYPHVHHTITHVEDAIDLDWDPDAPIDDEIYENIEEELPEEVQYYENETWEELTPDEPSIPSAKSSSASVESTITEMDSIFEQGPALLLDSDVDDLLRANNELYGRLIRRLNEPRNKGIISPDIIPAMVLAQLRKCEKLTPKWRADKLAYATRERLGSTISPKLVNTIKFKNVIHSMAEPICELPEMKPDSIKAERKRTKDLAITSFVNQKLNLLRMLEDENYVKQMEKSTAGRAVIQSDHITMIGEIHKIRSKSSRADVWNHYQTRIRPIKTHVFDK